MDINFRQGLGRWKSLYQCGAQEDGTFTAWHIRRWTGRDGSSSWDTISGSWE